MAIGIGLGLSFSRRRRGGNAPPSPIFITPAAAVATGSAIDPTVVADVLVTPAPAIAAGEVAAPQTAGDIIVSPPIAAAIAQAFAPTVVADVNVSPPPANATASAIAPSVLADTIAAVVYEGSLGYLLHTGGPAGAADGAALTVAWAGTFASDGSVHMLLDIPGTVPVKLYRDTDNTIIFRGGTGGAIFNCSTSAVAASLGFLIILASCNGTDAEIRVLHAGGTISSSNSPGSAADLDLTADWYFGCDASLANFLEADTAFWWADDSAIDLTDDDVIEQFWDTTAHLPRVLGGDGSNPLDGAFSPLICHQAAAAAHVVNSGTGGDADTAGSFTDGTSPGTYAADFSAETPTLPLVAFYPASASNDNGWGVEFGNPGPFGVDSPYNCASFWIMRRPGSASPPDTDASLGGVIVATSSGSFSITSAIRVKGDTGNKWKVASSIGGRQIFSAAEIPDDGVPHHVAISHHLGLTESIINGTFATNSDWVYNANGSTAFAYATDHAHFDGTAGDQYLEQQTLAADLVEGKRYRINYTLSNITGGTITTLVLSGHGAAGADVTLTATSGAKTVEWVQGPTNLTKLSIRAVASGVTFDIDSISVADIVECVRIDGAASSVSRSGTQASAPDTTRPTGVFVHGEGAKRMCDGALGELMFNIGREFIDFTDDANLARVYSAGEAVDVGANGAGWSPTGTTPAMYYTGTAQQMFASRGNITVGGVRSTSDPAGAFGSQVFTVPDAGIPIASAHADKISTFLTKLPNFNGTSSRMHSLVCTTLSNGKNFGFQIWINPDRANGTQEYLLDTGGSGFEILRQSGGSLQIIGRNGAGTTILDATFTGLTQNQTAVYHISGDMAVPASFKVIKNGSALTPTVATYTDDTLKFDVANMCVGATQAGASWYDGGLNIWMWAAHADLDAAAIAKLLTVAGSGGKPNFDRDTGMGDLGETVFGSDAVFAMPFADGNCHLHCGTLAANPTAANIGTADSAVIA